MLKSAVAPASGHRSAVCAHAQAKRRAPRSRWDQRKQFEALLARKAEENVQIQEELERVKARYAEWLKRNLDSMAQEKAIFGNWLTTRQQEAQNMKEAMDLCAKAEASEPAGNPLPGISMANARNKPA